MIIVHNATDTSLRFCISKWPGHPEGADKWETLHPHHSMSSGDESDDWRGVIVAVECGTKRKAFHAHGDARFAVYPDRIEVGGKPEAW